MTQKVELSEEQTRRIEARTNVTVRLDELEPVAREVIKMFRANTKNGRSNAEVKLWAKGIHDALGEVHIYPVMHPTITSGRLEMTSLTAVLVQLERDLAEVFGYAKTATQSNRFGIGIPTCTELIATDLDYLDAHRRET
ncbi:hypothetical protein FE633_17400 [Streptomyces montanus]|uniref:Uncharacterized protein n=1 Tax=Streptomyces montanus TaxID=2580423 RepID=A0A5R9FM00_9ACTN|nr:hypothetical protein [Streptomyces montanus]TLS44922.1 hypothetical protein FE633_17400 [Streptomyces montanus]